MKKILGIVVALAAGLCLGAGPVIDVRVEGTARQSLSMAGAQGVGSAGASFVSTLRNDLLRCGWYRLTEGNAQVKVTGSAAGEGGVSENLTVAWPGKRFAWVRSADSATQGRRHAHELADAIVGATTGEKGIAQSRFVMVAKTGTRRDGQAMEDLYICDYDGHNLTRLTNDGAPIVGPRWAPDGRTIYFTSYRKGYPAVYTVDIATRQVRPLASFRGLSTGAAASPADPAQVALILSHQGNPELYIMDTRTRRLTRLTETKLAAEASPCWSPDGRQICYVSDKSGSPQLYVVDVATKRSRQLTLRGGENVQPDWGKNGIVFATKRGCPYRIAVIDPARGEESTRFLTPVNEQYESPSWAPDGRHVVTSRTQGRQASIWVLDAAEGGAEPYKPFSGGGAQWLNPAWSK